MAPDRTASGGQSLPIPSHVSATSQSPAIGRQTSVLLASAGQYAPDPLQNSGRSQSPAAARQTTVVPFPSRGGVHAPALSPTPPGAGVSACRAALAPAP